jgi:hypothetical protein
MPILHRACAWPDQGLRDSTVNAMSSTRQTTGALAQCSVTGYTQSSQPPHRTWQLQAGAPYSDGAEHAHVPLVQAGGEERFGVGCWWVDLLVH